MLAVDVKIKPYTDATDVKKVQDELTRALEKEMNKRSSSKDKATMGMIKQTKHFLETAEKLDQKMEEVSNREFKFKGAAQMEKLDAKILELSLSLKKAKQDFENFADTDIGKQALESVDQKYAKQEEEYNERVENAQKQLNRIKAEETKLSADWINSDTLIENSKQAKANYEKLLAEAQDYYKKHKALMDRGEDKSTEGAQARERLQSLPKWIAQSEGEIKAFEQESDRIAKKLEQIIDESKEAENLLVQAEQARADFQVKKSENVQADLKQTPEYQAQEQEIANITAALEEQTAARRQLLSEEIDAEQEFAESVVRAQEEIRQAQDTNNDGMKTQLVQYREMGGKMSQALKIVLPIIGQITAGFGRLASLVPSALGRITSGIRRILSMLPLAKISSGIKGILTQLKRSTAIIAGMILGARGLQAIFNKVRTAFLAGFKDIYNQDKQFKTQIDTIKQKILDIQVALAEALMPVIQMALPYIKQFLDWIMSLLGTLTRFISTVTGIKAYSKAIKGLGGAAQQANKQLSKFDELNNLSSGGGGGLTPDNGSIGDPKKIDDWFTFVRNIIDKVEEMLRAIPWDDIYAKAERFGQIVGQILLAIFKPSLWNAIGETVAGVINTLFHFFNALGHTPDLFENVGKSIFQAITGLLDKLDFALITDTLITWADGFWTIIKTVLTERGETGETLAERIVRMITTSLSMINWQEVYAKVEEVATTLAETLNQLIDPNLAQEIGRTLGGTLMSIIKFAIAFFGEGGVDWQELGNTIASGINGFFEEFDGGEMAQAINAFFGAIITTIKAVIQEVNWGEVLSDIKALIAGIDWKSVLSVLAVLLAPQLFSIFMDIVKIVWDLVKVPLFKFLQTTVWPEIQAFFAEIFGNLSGFFSTVGGWISTTLALLLEFLGIWQLVAGLGESLSLLFGGKFMGASTEDWASSSPIAMLIKMITGDFDSSAWDEVWFEFFDNIVQFWTVDVPNFFNEHPLTGLIIGSGDISSLKEKAEEFFSGITEAWEKVDAWLLENVTPWFSSETWVELVQPIFDSIEQVWNNVVTWWNTNIVAWWDSDVAPWFTLAKWTGIVTNIKSSITDVWTQTKTWWSTNITSWWNDSVAPWFTLEKWTTLLDPIKEAFSSAFKAAANSAISILNSVIGAVETLINDGVIGGVNALINTANYLPGVDIPTFSGNISLPKIPALAQGTVIPPSMSDFIARLGDNNTETEIVSPLSTMKQAMIEALQEVGGGVGGDINVQLTVDGRVLAQTIVKQNEIYKKSSGRTLFA